MSLATASVTSHPYSDHELIIKYMSVIWLSLAKNGAACAVLTNILCWMHHRIDVLQRLGHGVCSHASPRKWSAGALQAETSTQEGIYMYIWVSRSHCTALGYLNRSLFNRNKWIKCAEIFRTLWHWKNKKVSQSCGDETESTFRLGNPKCTRLIGDDVRLFAGLLRPVKFKSSLIFNKIVF